MYADDLFLMCSATSRLQTSSMTLRLRHFIYDTSSTNTSSTDISPTSVSVSSRANQRRPLSYSFAKTC